MCECGQVPGQVWDHEVPNRKYRVRQLDLWGPSWPQVMIPLTTFTLWVLIQWPGNV